MSILKQVAELSASDCRRIELLESKIDLGNSVAIMHYGESVQRELANFIDQTLKDAIARSNDRLDQSSRSGAANQDPKELERQRLKLLADLKTLDRMHDRLLSYHREIVAHIIAGERKLTKTRPPQVHESLPSDGAPIELTLEQSDQRAKFNSFAARLKSLTTTEELCLQTAAQLQLTADASRQLASALLDQTSLSKLR